jgi:hypothetical protein
VRIFFALFGSHFWFHKGALGGTFVPVGISGGGGGVGDGGGVGGGGGACPSKRKIKSLKMTDFALFPPSLYLLLTFSHLSISLLLSFSPSHFLPSLHFSPTLFLLLTFFHLSISLLLSFSPLSISFLFSSGRKDAYESRNCPRN